MFPIDVSLLPSLATRKALLVVDAQNDFLAEDGALPVKMPIDLAQSISDFAGDFRRNGGEIIWVQSRFESSRPVDEEQILISDVTKPPPGSAPAPPRGRRPRASPTETETAPYSPEAFLTLGPGNGPQCVRDRTPGMEMHPTIKQSLGPRDHVLTKTFYSAFKVDELLRLLRMRLVTELFICGSSTNVGVMATAIDAAMYGYTITIVDDCCGAQSMSRHRMALRQITSTTGCETLSASKVLSMMRPSPPKKPQVSHSHSHHQRQERDRGVAAAAGGGKSPTVRVRRVRDDNAAAAVADVSSSVSEILQPSLERLSLSGEPAVADEYAPETTPVASPQQQQQQPQSRSRSQPRSRRALQSLAGSGHPQTTSTQRNQNNIASSSSPSSSSLSSPSLVCRSLPINNPVSAASSRRPSSTAKEKEEEEEDDDEDEEETGNPDGGRHDSGRRSGEPTVDAADQRSSPSPSSPRPRPRQKQKESNTTPHPSAAAGQELGLALRPKPNAKTIPGEDSNNANVEAEAPANKARRASKGVESPTTTTSDASSSSPGSLNPLLSESESESESPPPQSSSTGLSPASINTKHTHENGDKSDDASLPSSLKNTRHSETRSDLGSSDNISKSNLNNIGDSNNNSNTTPNMSPHPKASEPLCEGDTRVLYDVLPPSLSTSIFSRLQSEVAWARMSHQGGEVPRLVAVQGLVAPDGSKPVYRHPADASPPLHAFTPAVDEVRRVVEAHLGHELNHVLIQLYRTGEDYISEHSDKTLDIARGSYIANVSLGAERTMTLRTKRKPKKAFEGECEGGGGGKGGGVGGVETEDKDALKRTTQRAPLPHNSLFQMGLSTNARWLHGVRADKRLAREKSAAELSHSGERISLTFRRIATYLSADESLIWGQGATSKTRDAARGVVNGQTEEAVKMVRAFGRENQDTEFDWDRHYGEGFDVLHIGDAKRLFMSGDKVVDLRIRALAAQLGVSYARGMLGGEGGGAGAAGKGDMGGGDGEGGKKTLDIPIRFVDNDAPKTSVDGQAEIMLYLQRTYGGGPADNEDENKERVCGRWREGLELLDKWRSLSTPASSSDIDDILALLAPWEQYAGENTFIAGPSPSAADFAFWPVLRDVLDSSSPLLAQALLSGTGTEGTKEGNIVGLRAYDERMNVLEAIKRLLGS